MMNPINNLFSKQEQRLLLLVAFFALLGNALSLTGYTPALSAEPIASDSLGSALAEDVELKIDPRTASIEELMCLPGIGAKRAEDILIFRKRQSFSSVNQLMQVKGIGIKTYRRILPYLVIFGDTLATDSGNISGKASSAQDSRPIHINSASIEELCTLSGIGPKKAAAIIRYREENGAFSAPEDLCKVKGIGAKTLAKNIHRIRL
jgi:competence protein ComEA